MPRNISSAQHLAQQLARETLSANLKLFRERGKLSQEGLADLAGLHRTYVSQVERKLVNVSLDNLVLLADALGVALGDLFDPAVPPPKPVTSSENPA